MAPNHRDSLLRTRSLVIDPLRVAHINISGKFGKTEIAISYTSLSTLRLRPHTSVSTLLSEIQLWSHTSVSQQTEKTL